jgi:hypothetical protein
MDQPTPRGVRRRTWLAAALAFAAEQTAGNNAMADDTIVLDFAQSHIFQGFGVHAWIASPHLPQRGRLLRALNARFVRASLPGLVPDDRLPEHASVDAIDALIRNNSNAGTDGGMIRFRDELAGLGIRLHVIFWEMPAPWRRDGPKGARLAASEHLADYANFIVAHLLYVRRMGIVPEDVELTNEPNGTWNTQFTPEQYDQLVVLTRTGLDRAGLTDFRIEGPGTSGRPGDFMRELVRTGHVNLLGAYSFHEYDTRDGMEPAGLRVIGPSVGGAPPRPITITEFSSSNPRWNRPATLADGRPDPRPWSENPDFAISVAGEALQLIADGASEILVWHLEDLPWQTGRTGLLDSAGELKAVAEALISLFGSVTAGSRVAHTSPSVDKVPIVGFLNDDALTLCAVNLTAFGVILHVRAAGVPPPRAIARVTSFGISDPPEFGAAWAKVTCQPDGMIVVQLAARCCVAATLATKQD